MLEIELKLEVAAADAEALLGSALLRGLKTTDLVSVYFDTEARDLCGAGFSLRVRHEGVRRMQTVKAEGAGAGLFVRGEWEQKIDRDTPDLTSPALPLKQFVAAEALQRVAPVFRSQVRRSKGIRRSDDARIELVFDRGEVAAADSSSAVCEVEMELRQGPQAALFAMARRIDDVVPVRLGVLSKSERGYRLIDGSGARPAKAEPIRFGADATAATAFQAIAASCIRQFRLNETLLAQGDDPRALHQARVGLRRLRSALSLFRPMLADDAFGHVRGELRWISGVLGEARDIDVLIERFADDADVLTRLDEARRRAYADVAAALASARQRRLMLDLAEWLALGAWLTAPDTTDLRTRPASAAAVDLLDRHRRRVKRRGRDLRKLDDEPRHELRIEAKKLRYAAEFFAPLYAGDGRPHRPDPFGSALTELQDRLGELNDLATMPVVLNKLDLIDAVAGQIVTTKAKAKIVRRAKDAYDGLMKARRFWR